MRDILTQFNEQLAQGHDEWRFWGPHYVTHDRGEFTVRPFGGIKGRYAFEVRPEFIDGEVLWIFCVR